MDLTVFLAILGAALCHAAWNAGLKMRVDPAVAVTLLSLASAAVALPLFLFTGFPGRAAWPYLAASVIVHVGYFMSLAEAYRSGDLGQVYPIARGTAPLLTAIGSLLILHEPVAGQGVMGILLLAAGVLLLSLPHGERKEATTTRFNRRAIGFALLTAAIIATYTLIDGRGAQLSGNAHAYAVAFFVFNGVTMGLLGLVIQRPALLQAVRTVGWAVPLGGGVLSFVSYWIALWAVTRAPIALVAAVRETSVLFAAAIGIVLLKEAVVPARIIAAVLVVAGLILIRVS